jgi:hypothetical protein
MPLYAIVEASLAHEEATMPELPISWQVLFAVIATLMAIALLIDPAAPGRPDGQFTEVAELTF